jgi:hypothetical protein
VERSEGRIPALGHDLRPRLAHQPTGEPSRPGQQLAALVVRGGADGLLEELAGNAEGELTLEHRAARLENREPGVHRKRPGAPQQPALADPAGPSITKQLPAPSRVRATASPSASSSRSRSSRWGIEVVWRRIGATWRRPNPAERTAPAKVRCIPSPPGEPRPGSRPP